MLTMNRCLVDKRKSYHYNLRIALIINSSSVLLEGIIMKVRDMVYVSLFASLVAVLGRIPAIPLPFTPVPITMQTMGVMLAGSLLGARLGGLSMLVLILLAAVGAPVLYGGSGGLAHLIGPTGGYVLSWPLAAFTIGFLIQKFWNRLSVWKVFVFNILGGIIIVYSIGIPYLAAVTDMSLSFAILTNLAYIPGDLIKAFIAALITMQVIKTYPLINNK